MWKYQTELNCWNLSGIDCRNLPQMSISFTLYFNFLNPSKLTIENISSNVLEFAGEIAPIRESSGDRMVRDPVEPLMKPRQHEIYAPAGLSWLRGVRKGSI